MELEGARSTSRRFVDGDHQHATLLIVSPESDGDQFAPMVTALLAAFACSRRSRERPPSVALYLRVAARSRRSRQRAAVPRLPAHLSVGRGSGVQLLLAYHDLGRLEHASGSRRVARTILSNARLPIYYQQLKTFRPSSTSPSYWADRA